MATTHTTRQRGAGASNVARLAIGLIWLAGAAFNALVTLRMSNAFDWLEESPIPVYRWFFRDVVGAQPALWTILLVIGEVALGTLTLGPAKRARLGLAGGALFSALLFSLGTVYTLVMGPYALLLAWLARREYDAGPFDWLRSGFKRHGQREAHEPA
jgi:hypothetical protein